jgi:hypothetical protein
MISFYGMPGTSQPKRACLQLDIEHVFLTRRKTWLKGWFRNDSGEGEDDTPETRDPDTANEANGLQISRVKFEDLIKHFPDTTLSSESVLKREIRDLRAQFDGDNTTMSRCCISDWLQRYFVGLTTYRRKKSRLQGATAFLREKNASGRSSGRRYMGSSCCDNAVSYKQ